MAIDYSKFAISKGTPRIVDRIQQKKDLAAKERACRLAVKKRDKGRCVVPGCRDAAVHMHHVTYRSHGGKWRSENICSLCARHHGLIHAGLIHVSGNADEHLTFTGEMQYLKFKV